MIFSDKIYPRPVAEMILDGSKCQTRRLVKEGEQLAWLCVEKKIPMSVVQIKGIEETGLAKIKWQVGRDYTVQLGRGKPGLWYCLKCKATGVKDFFGIFGKHKHKKAKPLRIKLIGICKEHLLYISKEDAKKEGFKNKIDFLKAFAKISNPKLVKVLEDLEGKKYSHTLLAGFNPEVWVLNFEVVK